MTINHIDQLTEWWEAAEKGIPREGDTYIARFPSGDGYETGVVDGDGLPKGMLDDTRVLARSTNPKPAWHDAVAVIASHIDSAHRSTWTPDPIVPGMWITDDDQRDAEDLRDVTPLIEAKVTDEMVERAWAAVSEWPANTRSVVAEALAAALGLETA